MLSHVSLPGLSLALVAALIWMALALAPVPRVDAGSPGDTHWLGGFYSAEQGEGASFRWSGPGARLVLHGASSGPTRLSLRLSGEYLVARGEPDLSLLTETASSISFAVQPGWRVYHVLLPAGAAATPLGAARPIALRTALSQPDFRAEARDYRPIGIPLDWASLHPLVATPLVVLPRVLSLSWMLGLVGALAGWLALHAGWLATGAWPGTKRAASAAHRHPVSPARAMPARGDQGLDYRQAARVAGLVICVLGGVLVGWAWRDPAGLAWTLPPAPWALSSASVALAWLWSRHVPRLPGGATTATAGALALILLGAGVSLMHSQRALGGGMALAALGVLLFAWLAESAGGAWWSQTDAISPRTAITALLLIFLLALGLRLFRLDELPFGLWRDEARHGLVALRIAQDPSYRPVYILDYQVHLPGLGLYPFALAIQLFGPTMWSLRIVTTLAGALTVLPLYAVAARLSGSRALGLGAALLLATSSWHLSVGRLAFPTIYEPLLSLSAWLLLLVALAQRATPGPDGAAAPRRLSAGLRRLAGFGSGVMLGLAAQTYHTGRVMPLAALLLALLLLVQAPQAWRKWLSVMALAALGFALTTAPLALYALNQPEAFNDRVGKVFLLDSEHLDGQAPLRLLDANLARHLLMFNASGDANGRHHAPLRPLLDIIAALGLLLGLVALLRHGSDWRSRFLAGTLVIGLLPGLLAVDAPHAMRTFGAVVPTYLTAALGWAWILRLAAPRAPLRQLSLSLGLVALISLNGWLYFAVMARSPQVFLNFYLIQSQMGLYLRELADQGELPAQIFVPEGMQNDPVFAFLTTGLSVETFAGAQLSTPAGPGAIFLLSGYFVAQEAADLAPILGPAATPAALGPLFPDGSQRTFYVYRLDE